MQLKKHTLTIIFSLIVINTFSQSRFILSSKAGASIPLGKFASKSFTSDYQGGYAQAGSNLNLATGTYVLKNNIIVFGQISFQAFAYDFDAYENQIKQLIETTIPEHVDYYNSSRVMNATATTSVYNFIIGSGYNYKKNKFNLDFKLGIGLFSMTDGRSDYNLRAYNNNYTSTHSQHINTSNSNTYTYADSPIFTYSSSQRNSLSGMLMLGTDIRYDLFKHIGGILGSIDFYKSIGAVSDRTIGINYKGVGNNITSSVQTPVSSLNFDLGLYFYIGKER